jgi:hypothetical protein
MQRLFAIAGLTWKAAFRFRLFLVIAVLLIGSVVALPLLIKDDGTARGCAQILLTYTLSTITALLGLSTLWLACGTLARDVEECQIQMVAVKPIARWQIWLGKWLGIMTLNAALLALTGASVYGLLLWRASRLPAEQRQILRNEVLVARASAKPPNVEREIQDRANQLIRDRLQKMPTAQLTQTELVEVGKQIFEQVKAGYQIVLPDYQRTWEIPMSSARHAPSDQPFYLRIKFNAAQSSSSGTFGGFWQIGAARPDRPPPVRLPPMSLAPDTFHEFEIPSNLLDEDGVLTVSFANLNDTALLFPLEDGIEVLYREGNFGLNFARGLGVIFCWMALLSALGLASASFLSFPVAAFLSLAALTLAFSSGTMAGVVASGSVLGADEETGIPGHSIIDGLAVPTFRAVLAVINLAKDFSPIDSLSTGRSITWGELGRAFSQIVLLLGGLISLAGIAIFNRRELATAQGTQ